MRKKRSEEIIRRAEDALDLSRGLLSDTPLITLHGASLCEIDNFKALLDFSSTALRVNTAGGIVALAGANLEIAVLTDENITVKGEIKKIEFE